MQTSRPSSSQAGGGGAPSASERLGFVDCAKGLGILLVVLGHALGGIISASLTRQHDAYELLFNAIYYFHMPVFFFLSGLFVRPRLDKGRAGFVRGAASSLARPYLLWLPVQLLMLDLASSHTNTSYHFSAYDYLTILWNPGGQFWYLYALLIMHLIAAWVLPRFGMSVLLALGLLGYGLGVHKLWGPFTGVARFGVFYVLGVAFFEQARDVRMSPASLRWSTLASTLLSIAVFGWSLAMGFRYWTVDSLPAAVLGSVWMLQCAALLSSTPLAKTLAYLGKQSMPIFCLHIMFCAGARMLLNKVVGWSAPLPILLGVLAIGVMGPLACYLIAEKLGLAWALGFTTKRRPREPVAARPVLQPADHPTR